MQKNFLAMASWLAIAWGTTGIAQAAPTFQILGGNAESIGDKGGTSYPSAPSASPVNGAGLPTINGGWPNATGFGEDLSYPVGCTAGSNCSHGISGFDESYLKITEPGTVTFQFMGKGDAIDHNLFQIYLNGAWQTIFDTAGSHGTCGASGSPTPTVSCSTAGSTVSFNFPAGYVPFRFVNLTTPGTATNNGSGNGGHTVGGYFLGMDPYQATGQYTSTGQVVYAGYTDRPCAVGATCDHDYEDLIVRMAVSGGATSIPTLSEWGMILLSSLLGLGATLTLRRQRRQA